MDRRDAPQHALAHVQGRSVVASRREQSDRRVTGVGNAAKSVDGIEPSSLGGDVGSREVKAEVRRSKLIVLRLRDHHAIPVGVETIDHDAVITDDPADFVGRHLAERLLALGGLKPGGRLPDLVVEDPNSLDIFVLDRLGFEDELADRPCGPARRSDDPPGRSGSRSLSGLARMRSSPRRIIFRWAI